ncbi:unannotated protein [freshwater metagenome]|uniref:Unannotated protein n=1 Tax=freshwater metagenome TaxID=449393 RepID=A0A6J6XNV5_9ZZZZ
MLGKPRDAMQDGFDGMRIEGGQRRTVWEEFLVTHDRDTITRRIEPIGNLIVGHQIDVADPIRKSGHGTQRVLQLIARRESGFIGSQWIELGTFVLA